MKTTKRLLRIDKNQNNHYSTSSAWIAFLFSLYGLTLLYIYYSPFWIVLSISFISTFITLVAGIQNFLKLFNLNSIILPYRAYIINFLSLGFFLLATYGFIQFLTFIPLRDKSILLLPAIGCIFIFGGAAIGIYKDSDE